MLLMVVSSADSSKCVGEFDLVLCLMQPFLAQQTCLIFLAMRGENLTVCAECELDAHMKLIKEPIAMHFFVI